MRFAFGKYKGVFMGEVPTSYLRWVVENDIKGMMDDGKTTAVDAAEEELELRGES
jgi:uncharacterized protein (DUF3820 family)